MKINYVSVKGYETTHSGTRLCLRAELDGEPTGSWSRLFRRIWLSRQPGSLPALIRFSGCDILLYIPDADSLTLTIDALKSTLTEVEDQLGSHR